MKQRDEIVRELIIDLSKLTYKSDNGQFDFKVINNENLPKVETAIRQRIDAQFMESDIEFKTKIAILESKVFVYEQIISNSNFSQMINQNNQIDKDETNT